ncbi:MAG TPA: VOC family protein [Archangium sp.]|uniref:VOC family protein n=1 Tax=Archangium sp. TaxID=1872627 RepID=UPI002E344C62|nr:VOC family protein [Archangium sp.]HEX5753191.1 VOC family protein [Archangium sp.]
MSSTIATFLMFEGKKAEEAMTFYVSLFKDASITHIQRYGPGEPGTEGSVMQASFTLNGQRFMCIDSSMKHGFTFTPATSIFVTTDSEAELDTLAAKLGEGGQVMMPLGEYPFSRKFTWLADRYGVSWQLSLKTA